MSVFSPWSIAKAGARLVLGERRYLEFRDRLWELRGELTPSPVRLRQLHARLLEVRARFKSYVLQSLDRQRALEKELARLKYPALCRGDLDVVAEIVVQGDMAPGSADSVSVVITNYNYGRYLPEAIESVLAQAHRPVELVVIDDASRDGSAEVLERALGRGDAVSSTRILLKHNIGQAAARNVGVRLARGEFAFILDADNRLLPGCLERHVRAARAADADAAYAVVRVFGPVSYRREVLSDGPFNVERLSKGNYIDAMALFRRSALLEAGLYSTELVLYGVEDYELWLRFAAQRRKVEFVPDVLSEYRVHGQNLLSVAELDLRGALAHLHTKYPGIFSESLPHR